MAFNLNKNEDPADTSKNSGFDLNKNTQQTDVLTKKTSYWPYLIAALLIIGASAWYLQQGKTTGEHPSRDSNLVSSTGKSDTTRGKIKAGDSQSVAGRVTNGRAVKETGPVTDGIADPSDNTAATAIANSVPLVAASFAPGSSNPKKMRAILNKIQKMQAADAALHVRVLGYASSEGDPAINLAISQARAVAYKEFLVQNGFAESRITAMGKGTEDPIASNATENGRKKNRRVEVLFNQQQ